jgi:hypothetical protein
MFLLQTNRDCFSHSAIDAQQVSLVTLFIAHYTSHPKKDTASEAAFKPDRGSHAGDHDVGQLFFLQKREKPILAKTTVSANAGDF